MTGQGVVIVGIIILLLSNWAYI